MNLILADTSGLYSLLNRADQYHKSAREFYDALPVQAQFVVLEYILVET